MWTGAILKRRADISGIVSFTFPAPVLLRGIRHRPTRRAPGLGEFAQGPGPRAGGLQARSVARWLTTVAGNCSPRPAAGSTSAQAPSSRWSNSCARNSPPWRDVKALVTGATGFVGRAVLAQLTQAGWQIRILARNPQAELVRNLAAIHGAEICAGDILDPASLTTAFVNVDAANSHGFWHHQRTRRQHLPKISTPAARKTSSSPPSPRA